MRFPFFLLSPVAIAAILAFAPLTAPGAEGEQPLVPANSMNAKQDSQGYAWDVVQNGTVADGSDDCFDNGMVLQINGSNGNFQRPMMTADGSEYVLSGRFNSGITVKRQIQFDAKRAFVRYLEIVENTGSQPQKATLIIRSELGGNCQAVLTNTGSPYNGSLGRSDAGIVALQPPGSRPSVVWLLGDSRSKLKPNISVQNNNRTFLFSYTLDLPPKTPVGVLHYVAQRRNALANNAAQLFAGIYVYKGGRLFDAKLPKTARKLVTNFASIGGEAPEDEAAAKTVLQPLRDLLENSGVERGASDLLVFGEAGKIAGDVTGDDFRVETAYGATTVPLADVAALSGGAGVQRPMQVYLRTGEILSGAVKAEHLLLTTPTGWKADIKPEQINLLLLRAIPRDGAESPESAGLLQTESGDRIALAADQNCAVEAATPWGNLQTTLDQITRIIYVREPYPSQRITLANKTQVFGILRGGDLALNTLRFGAVKVPPRAIRELRRALPAKKEAPPETEAPASEGDAADETALGSKTDPSCQLVGENVLAGTIDLPELHLDTNGGTTLLDPKTLRSMQRVDNVQEGGGLTFTVKLAGGDEITGQIEERVLPIRSGEKVWRVPLIHLVSASNPPPAAPAKPAESPAPTSSPAASEPKP